MKGETKIATLIDGRLRELIYSGKDPAQIAEDAGFDKFETLRRFADGETRVPLDHAIPLGLSLGLDPGQVMIAALRQHDLVPEGTCMTFAEPPTREPTIVDLNFKVSAQFHRQFKMAAVSRGWAMKELLEKSFTAFELDAGYSNEMRPKR